MQGLERLIDTYQSSRQTRVGERRSPVRTARDRLIILRALKMALPGDLKDRSWMLLHVQRADL